MHQTSMDSMQWIINTYFKGIVGRVLDVGACVTEYGAENYRRLFKDTSLVYTGCDICKGNNVDVEMPTPYEIPSQWGKFEVIVSGQAAEHVQDVYKWVKALRCALQPQGYLAIISPFDFRIHRYPFDCWRILPDGYIWLLGEFLKMDVLYADKRKCDIVAVARLK